MKTFEYKFTLKPGIFNYIMSEFNFNEHKKEKEILKLLVDGYTCSEIADKIGYSDRTIVNRRKDLYEKIKTYI